MKQNNFLITLVAVLSLLFASVGSAASTVSAQIDTPGDEQAQENTYTTTQGDTLGDLLDRAGVNVNAFDQADEAFDLSQLRSFVSQNRNLRFQPGSTVVIPRVFDDISSLGQVDQLSLGRIADRLGLLDDDARLRSFMAVNLDTPVQAGQTVSLETSTDTPTLLDDDILGDETEDQQDQEQDQTQEAVIPQTGQPSAQQAVNAPIYGSALTSWGVYGRRGELTGEVRGFILDTNSGQVPYIVVLGDYVLSYHTVLIPWDSFSIIESPTSISFFGNGDDGDANVGRALDPSRDMAIQLQITEQQFEDAPGFDMSVFDDPTNLSTDWDAEAVDYWNNALANTNLSVHQQSEGLMLVKSGIFDRIDFDVQNTNGDDLGEIEHLLINGDGSARYALLDPDNLNLNLNDQFVVVSLQAMNWNPDEDAFITNVPEGALTGAPVFDPINLPDFNLPDWDADWNDHWSQYEGQTGGALPVTGNGVARSDILGDPIYYGQDNQYLGSVQNVITGDDNQIDYVVTYDSVNDQFHPIPFDRVDYDSNNDQLTYNGDLNQFRNSPGFDNLNDINTGQAGWNNDIDTYWDNQ